MGNVRPILLLTIVLISRVVHAQDLPFRGIVTDPIGKPFSLRLSPPTATKTGYSLGDFACAVFPGTTLYATDQRQIANGEVWYFVQVERPSGSTNLRKTECAAATTGWVIGVMKNATPVIVAQEENASPPSGSGVVPPRRITPREFRADEQHGFLGLYVMLVIGTLIGVAVVAWERHGSITTDPLRNPLTLFEAAVLVIGNVILMTTVVPKYFTIDSSSVNARMLQALTQSAQGHFIIGFTLSVLLMQAISFARR